MAPPPVAPAPEPSGPCPCGLGRAHQDCCGPVIEGRRPAATAEQLMRSRYTAFVLQDATYLLHSWLPSRRPRRITFVPDQQWVRLVVHDTEAGGLLDDAGIVEFTASYRRGDEPGSLHERSSFVRHDGRWVYVGPLDER